jgi:hypothetical protein
MVERNPTVRNQLSSWREAGLSWRQVAGISKPETGESVRQRLADRHLLLRDLLLDTVTELDLTYDAVSQYLDQTERSLPHAQWLDERTGYVLKRYEYAVSQLLEQAISGVTAPSPPRIREVVKPLFVSPPPAKSFLQRLLGG